MNKLLIMFALVNVSCSTPQKVNIMEITKKTVVVHCGHQMGTGVIDGDRIITASHLGVESNTFSIATASNPRTFIDCIVVYDNKVDDIVILKPTKDIGDYPPIRYAGSVSIGDEVFSINHIHGLTFTYMTGYFANKRDGRLVFDIEAYSGSSGGGIFTPDGKLIGIISSTYIWSAHTMVVPNNVIPR